MRVLYATVALLALYSRTAYCQDEDEDMGGGGDDEDMGGGGDEEEPSPPPPSGLQELLGQDDFDGFIDHADASVILAIPAKTIVDPKAKQPADWDADEDGEWEAPTIEHPMLTSITAISGSAYDYRFAWTMEPALLSKLKVKSGSLFLYRSPKFLSKEHGDRPRERFPSDALSESAVTNWLNTKAQPLVGQFSMSTKARYTKPVLVIFMNLDFDKNGKSITYVLKRARKTASALKGKLSFAVASSSDMSYEMGDFGLKTDKPNTDILMGIKAGDDYYKSADGTAFNALSLAGLADGYLKGELEKFVKPPEPPVDDNDIGGPNVDDDEESDGIKEPEEAEEDAKDEM
jgi:hypothetical protein